MLKAFRSMLPGFKTGKRSRRDVVDELDRVKRALHMQNEILGRVLGVRIHEAASGTFHADEWARPDLAALSRFEAGLESARYLARRMGAVAFHEDAAALRAAAVGLIAPDGLVLEFGVASGKSITEIARALPSRIVHGFDSFQGLPEAWRPGFGKGQFAQSPPSLPDNIRLQVGLFEDTLPAFLQAHPGPVAFLHVDCDLYVSTATVFRYLSDRLRPGTVIVFDEYFNYPGWRLHEHKAFLEWTRARRVKFDYVAAVPSGEQVAVVLKGTL